MADDEHQVNLFEFLRTVAVAAYRGRKQAALAQLVALESDGTSGTGVVVRASKDKPGPRDLTVELGISVSQVWRQFRELRDGGWFEQTSRPARGARPGEGRAARYRCTVPPLDLGLLPLAEGNGGAEDMTRVAAPSAGARHDPEPTEPVDKSDHVAPSGEEARHDAAPIVSQDSDSGARSDSGDATGSCRGSDPDRVAVSGETCSTATHPTMCKRYTSFIGDGADEHDSLDVSPFGLEPGTQRIRGRRTAPIVAPGPEITSGSDTP